MNGPPLIRAAPLLLALLGGSLLVGCSSDDEGSGPDEATFCAKVAEFNTGTQAFDLNVADDAEVERIAVLLDEIAEAAPEEIRADVEERFAFVDIVVAASQGDDEAIAELAEIDPSATEEARVRIDAYAQEQCGITLEPAAPTATTTPGVLPPPTVATTLPPDTDTTVPADGTTTVPPTTPTTSAPA